MYAIGIIAVGVLIGFMAHDSIESIFKMKEKRQEKALCEHFNCNKNDFSYFWSQYDDFFVATVKNKEYHVKFSQNQPIKVIFAQELETFETIVE
jgi:hypothetical protein